MSTIKICCYSGECRYNCHGDCNRGSIEIIGGECDSYELEELEEEEE